MLATYRLPHRIFLYIKTCLLNHSIILYKRALTSTGFDYLAAHVGWAKINTDTFYPTSTGFNVITL